MTLNLLPRLSKKCRPLWISGRLSLDQRAIVIGKTGETTKALFLVVVKMTLNLRVSEGTYQNVDSATTTWLARRALSRTDANSAFVVAGVFLEPRFHSHINEDDNDDVVEAVLQWAGITCGRRGVHF